MSPQERKEAVKKYITRDKPPPKSARLYEVDGRRLSVSQWAKVLGVTTDALAHRGRYIKMNTGVTIEAGTVEAIKELLTGEHRRVRTFVCKEKLIEVDGASLSVKQWCDKIGMSETLFYAVARRLAQEGYPKEKVREAAIRSLMHGIDRRVAHGGYTMTIRGWALAWSYEPEALSALLDAEVRTRKVTLEKALASAREKIR